MIEFVRIDRITGAYIGHGNVDERHLADQEQPGELCLRFPAASIVREVIDGRTSITVDVAILKSVLLQRVDAEAGAFRSRFITVSPGQEATYLRKEDEARRYAASGGAGSYPFLSAEATATGATLAAVATLVLETADQWVPLGAAIEGRRRAAKLAIEAATTIPAVIAAATVDWDALLP